MMKPQDIEQTAARRAYKAGLGVSEWEACLLPNELLALMRAYRASNETLIAALDLADKTLHRLATRLSDVGAYGLPEDLSGHYNGTGTDGETVQTFQALTSALAAARGGEGR